MSKSEIPVIYYSEPGFKIIGTGNKVFELIEMSEKGVLSVPGSNNKNISKGVMAINGNKIWHYGIKKDYIKYAIIQEILCPDMINGFGLNSIKEEIKNIPENIKEDYIEWRISFFENMKEYWVGISDNNLRSLNLLEKDKKQYSKNIKKIIDFLYRIKLISENKSRQEKSNNLYWKEVNKWKKNNYENKLYEHYKIMFKNLSENQFYILRIIYKAGKALTIREISENRIFKNNPKVSSKYISAILNGSGLYSIPKNKIYKFQIFERTSDGKISISLKDSHLKKYIDIFLQIK